MSRRKRRSEGLGRLTTGQRFLETQKTKYKMTKQTCTIHPQNKDDEKQHVFQKEKVIKLSCVSDDYKKNGKQNKKVRERVAQRGQNLEKKRD